MDPIRFDRLTKSLGTARSRRTMLQTLGAATLGALGLAGVSRVDAAKGGNSAAAAFCHTVFGDTRAAGQCTSQAAHGTGPYVECGGDPTNYCHGTCCAGGEVCQHGTCVSATCPVGGDTCLAPPTCGSNSNGTCFCATDVNGHNVCRSTGSCAACASDADCPGSGSFCVQAPSCCGYTGGTACVAPC